MATHRAEVRHSRKQSRDRIVAAATELVRHTSYGELSVDEVMREAGIGRTIFYRHFDDLADLLMRAAREAVEELYEAHRALAAAHLGDGPDVIRQTIEPAVAVYQRHGPLLRAITEAAADDEQIAAGREAMRQRFDELLADALREMRRPTSPRRRARSTSSTRATCWTHSAASRACPPRRPCRR
jgi:TetR/AcrR family transcriptional regulator, ethionamide resistance regulator